MKTTKTKELPLLVKDKLKSIDRDLAFLQGRFRDILTTAVEVMGYDIQNVKLNADFELEIQVEDKTIPDDGKE